VDYSAINTTFGVLAVAADTATAILVVGWMGTRLSRGGRTRWRSFRGATGGLGLPLAWIVAVFCTCSSLFLQFGEDLTPCDLCWFQRICMYPLVLILGVAVFSDDRRAAKRYAVPLAAIGAVISIIHINLTTIMKWMNTSTFPGCSFSEPCTFQPLRIWGFATVPFMALAGFLLIIAVLLLLPRRDAPAEPTLPVEGYQQPA
jgi:Disulfide bond formation protein DsbB